jgi:ABC-type transport system involved in multi-copper enzyme maturation permease subunit
VAIKEFLELLVSGRFLVAAVIVFGLVATTVGVLARTYTRELADYGVAMGQRDESLRQYGHLNRLGAWSMPERPNPMTVVVRGLEQNANLEAFDNDPLAVGYPLPDFTVIVGVLFSLIALLFAYDALSGEREDGTLRLLLAHDTPRAGLVVGKIAGRFLALIVPLAAGLLVGALIVALSPNVGWTGTEWGAAAALGLAAALYILVFVCLGVMVSAWTRLARTSLVVSLGIWAAAILVVPNLSPYVAATLQPTPSVTQLQRRVRVMRDTERDELLRQMAREAQGPYREQHPELEAYFALGREERARAREADPQLAVAVDSLRTLGEWAAREANRIQREKVEALQSDFEIRQQAQLRATQVVSSASPLPVFVYASLDLTETGLRADARREEQQSVFGETVLRPWIDAMMDSLRAVDPTIDVNTHVDLSGIPDFSYQPEPLGSRLAAALPRLGLLLGFGFVFLAFGVVGFNRYDVR